MKNQKWLTENVSESMQNLLRLVYDLRYWQKKYYSSGHKSDYKKEVVAAERLDAYLKIYEKKL